MTFPGLTPLPTLVGPGAAPATPDTASGAPPNESLGTSGPAVPAVPAVPAIPAAWLADRAGLDEDVRAAAKDALDAGEPGALVGTLLDLDRVADALRVVACALPPREGVWWAWVAARHATQAAPSPKQLAALDATERWIERPADPRRRACWDAAQGAGLDTPAGCVAAAVFFAGGSVTPPHGPVVPPPAGLYATLASTAVLLSAVATDAGRLREVAAAFAQQGAEIVRRLGGWDAAVAAAKQVFDTQAYQHAEASKPPKLPEPV